MRHILRCFFKDKISNEGISTMSNLIQRNVKVATSEKSAKKLSEMSGASEEEMEPLPSVPSGEDIPQDSGEIKVVHFPFFKDLPPKWKNVSKCS